MSVNRTSIEEHLKEKDYLSSLCYLYLPQFRESILMLMRDIDLSRQFIDILFSKSQLEELNQKWMERGVLEGFPAVCSWRNEANELHPFDEAKSMFSYMWTNSRVWRSEVRQRIPCNYIKLPSLLEMSSLLELLIRVSSQHTLSIIGSAIRYSHNRLLNLSRHIMKEAVEQAPAGLIVFMDIDRTTPQTIKAETIGQLPEHNTRIQHLFRRIANVIFLEERNTRYWLLGGDSLVSFSEPSDLNKTRETVFRIISAINRELKKIEKDDGISFLCGAHWGRLLLVGDKIYLNVDYIRAVRAQEFCRKVGEIVITKAIKEKTSPLPNGYAFTVPEVPAEGKRYAWVRPQAISVQFGSERTELFTIVERR